MARLQTAANMHTIEKIEHEPSVGVSTIPGDPLVMCLPIGGSAPVLRGSCLIVLHIQPSLA